MAELGETTDPRVLVPGHAEAVRAEIRLCREYSAALIRAGDGLKRVDTGEWFGEAAEAFHAVFDGHPLQWIKAGDLFLTAGEELTRFVETLEWAQAQAREAIAVWEEGQAATAQAGAEERAGQSDAPGAAPLVGPGAEKRQAAQDTLHRARLQLTEAGDRAADALARAQEDAPPLPSTGKQVTTVVAEFATGLGQSLWEFGQLAWKIDPARLYVEPQQVWRDLTGLSTRMASLDAGQMVRSTLHVDQFQTNPARAAGSVAPDVALTAAGGLGVVKKGGTAARAAHGALRTARANRVLAKAKYQGKGVADHVATKGAHIGRAPVRSKKKPIRLVDDVGELDRAWQDLSRGGQSIHQPNYPGQSVQLPDGSTIAYRTKPGRGPEGHTIDMTGPDGRELKIHVDPPKGS